MKQKLEQLYRTNPARWMWVMLGAVTAVLLILGAIPVLGQLTALAWLIAVPWIIIKSRKSSKAQPRNEIRNALTYSRQHPHTHQSVVQVKYANDPDSERAWCYEWPFGELPEIGSHVVVNGWDGDSFATIVGHGRTPEAATMTLAQVERTATPIEFEAALQAIQTAAANAARQHTADEVAWLNQARKAVGLPVTGRVRKATPEGFSPVPPTDGTVSPEIAGEFGRVWWRIYKLAERLDRDPEEIKKFAAVAHRWYAIRDKR